MVSRGKKGRPLELVLSSESIPAKESPRGNDCSCTPLKNGKETIIKTQKIPCFIVAEK